MPSTASTRSAPAPLAPICRRPLTAYVVPAFALAWRPLIGCLSGWC
jgi:hypothetical protein